MPELSYTDFVERARRLDGPDRGLYEDLFPMVRDLLSMAERLDELMASPYEEIPELRLSFDARGPQ